jgi:hypothetical protein
MSTAETTTHDYRAWAELLKELDRALSALAPLAQNIGVAPPEDSEWCELLRHKLLPQLEGEPYMVVAFAGGTNIGKSVLFNHLAGEQASGVSPLAAGTKQPVCLVPPGMDEPAALASWFEGFRLIAWESPEQPLAESDEHRLFWRVGSQVPPRLLLLDTPDVDSDAQVNWQRARTVRQTADVLVAVLTQQKYNDAAVKQFFREAADADKPIVVVFNQCDVEADAPYWPQWLRTFCDEIGTRPDLVYVVPRDRRAAESLELPFYMVGPDGRQPVGEPSTLRDELAAMRFDQIKIRTFRGAVARLLDPQHGAAGYLARIRRQSDEFAAAAAALSAGDMARVAWPSLPADVLVDEIRRWWDENRAAWSQKIHGFYRAVGRGVVWPVRKAMETMGTQQRDPLVSLHRRERQAIVLAVEKLLDELQRLAQVGNETLRPRLNRLLQGSAREKLIERVQQAHDQLPTVDQDYREFLAAELEAWKEANPRAIRLLRSLDHAAAIARPAITVSLAVSGWVLAGDLVGQAAVHAASHTASELAAEAAIAGGITGGGEALVSTTSEGVRQAAAKLFMRMQARYAQQRAAWLANWLENELLGPLLSELRNGAEITREEPFQQVEGALEALRPYAAATV